MKIYNKTKNVKKTGVLFVFNCIIILRVYRNERKIIMKKSGILLLASAALLLSSCGAKYTLKGDEGTVLTLGGSSFSIVDEGDKMISTVKGKAEKGDKEGQYKLTVTSETYQLEKGETLTKLEEGLLGIAWSSADIEKLNEGKKVTKELKEENYYTVTVAVDKEAKTYSVVLFK